MLLQAPERVKWNGYNTPVSEFPDWKQKQQVLFGAKANPEERLRIAAALIEADRDAEAVDYLEIDRDKEMLRQVLERAAGRGDAFVYRRAADLLDMRPSGDDWEGVAAQAEAAGKPSYARLAREAAKKP